VACVPHQEVRLRRPPLLGDSELVCLAAAQALLGYREPGRQLLSGPLGHLRGQVIRAELPRTGGDFG
jgi:hypothetical protein